MNEAWFSSLGQSPASLSYHTTCTSLAARRECKQRVGGSAADNASDRRTSDLLSLRRSRAERPSRPWGCCCSPVIYNLIRYWSMSGSAGELLVCYSYQSKGRWASCWPPFMLHYSPK